MPNIGQMKLITLHLPVRWIQDLDQLVFEHKYANRPEAIRAGVRDLLVNEVWTPRFEDHKYNPHLGQCQICEREGVHVENHHLIPKDPKSEKITVCEPCGDQIHVLSTNVELAQTYNTLEKLKSHPKIQKFVKWLRKHNPNHVKVRESLHVKKWRRRKR